MGIELRVAILGPLGTYTHEAAHEVFGSTSIYEEQSSISDVFAILAKNIPLGVVPHENSMFGAVTETYDLLRKTSCFVCGEVTLKIEHSLLVKRGVRLHDIKKVFSHEQALGQCRSFMTEKLPGVTIVKTASTAAAAQILLNEPPDCAAICSAVCGKLYEGLEVLFTDIQNMNENFTTFYILVFDKDWESPTVLPRTVHRKALIRLQLDTEDHFQQRDIVEYLKTMDLSVGRISCRPSLQAIPFQYVHFVEAFDPDDSEISAWRTNVEKATERLKGTGMEVDVIGIW